MPSAGMKVAIVGVPGSGKTQLAGELIRHFPQLTVVDAPDRDSLGWAGFDCVLLTGLDLPGCAQHSQADLAWRDTLKQAGLPYSVVYGMGAQRLRQAVRLIAPEPTVAPRWHGVCEKCADPDCELRLFTGLKASKAPENPRT